MKKKNTASTTSVTLYQHEYDWLDAVVESEPEARNSRSEVVRAMIRFFVSLGVNPFTRNHVQTLTDESDKAAD